MTTDAYSDSTRKWIRYEDGTYEPVRLSEDLMDKRRGPGIPDWWVVDMPRNWAPQANAYPYTDNHPSGPLTARRDAEFFGLHISRHADGKIAKRVMNLENFSRSYDYRYDEEGRLTEVHGNGTLVEWYRYDSRGRRHMDMLARLGFRERRFEYGSDNRLLRAGNVSYEHDEFDFRSAMIGSEGRCEYQYAPDYRLLEVRLPDETVVEYEHDEDDLRCAKYIDGRFVEGYRWLDMIRLSSFHDGNEEHIFLYDKEERLPYAMTCGKDILQLRYDQIGSLIAVADGSGDVIKQLEYDSFGAILNDSNPALRIPIGFGGGLHDPHTGWVRFGWRDYDPDTGRWTAKDPVGPAGGDPDFYRYCFDDPVNEVDPLGLFVFGGLGIAGLGALGAAAVRAAPHAIRLAKRFGPPAMRAAKNTPKTLLRLGKQAADTAGKLWDKTAPGREAIARQATAHGKRTAEKVTRAGEKTAQQWKRLDQVAKSHPGASMKLQDITLDTINPGLPPESRAIQLYQAGQALYTEGKNAFDGLVEDHQNNKTELSRNMREKKFPYYWGH